MAHDHYPRGAGGLIGGPVDSDFVFRHGSRAQKRLMAKQLKRQRAVKSQISAKKAAKK